MDSALQAAEEEPEAGADLPEAETGFTSFADPSLPRQMGRFQLLARIGMGGMGTVYEAEDLQVRRRVALKIIRGSAFATVEDVARFRVEAEAVARLDHPHIMPVQEVGEWEGTPYFTMKLIRGGTLSHRLAAGGRMTPVESATLAAKLARALHHAHERGVLHRDVKPGNVLIDSAGEPILSDFGLAKLVGGDTDFTLTQAHLGTPQHMSPEQARGRARDVTAASDVWSLGVMLYQMLAGRLPFSGGSPAEIFRKVTEEDPVPLAPGLPGSAGAPGIDLVTLVQRCLEKDPARRLPSALFLAEELERYLAGKPVLSRRVTSREKAFRWMRRHPWQVAALLCFGMAVAAGLTGGAVSYQEMSKARAAQAAALRSDAAARSALGEALRSDAAAKTALADALLRENNCGEARRVLATVPEALREANWTYLEERSDAAIMQLEPEHQLGAIAADPTRPDVFAVAREDHVIVFVNGRTGERLLEIPTGITPPPYGGKIPRPFRYSVAVSPDGSEVAVGHSAVESIRIFSAKDASLLRTWPSHTTQDLFYRPGTDHAKQLLIQPYQNQPGQPARNRRLHDTGTGEMVWEHDAGRVAELAWMRDLFLPQGDALIAATGTDLVLLDAATGKQIRAFPQLASFPHAIASSGSGSRATIADENGRLTSFKPRAGEFLWSSQAEAGPITSLFYTLNGERLVGTSTPWRQSFFRASIWDSGTGSFLEPLHGLVETGHHTVRHPLSGLLAISGGTCRIFETAQAAPEWNIPLIVTGGGLAFLPDNQTLCYAGGGQALRQLLADGNSQTRWQMTGNFGHLALAQPVPSKPGEKLRVVAEIWQDNQIHHLRLERDGDGVFREAARWPMAEAAYLLLPSPDGTRYWTGQALIDPATGKELSRLFAIGSGAMIGAWWPTADRIVLLSATSAQSVLSTQNPDTGAETQRLELPVNLRSMALSADSRLIALGGSDKLVRVLELATFKEIHRFRAHDANVIALAFHPAGDRLATAADDGTIRVWQWAKSQLLTALRPSTLGSDHLCFSPDGQLLAAYGSDRQLRVWRGLP